ncbi:MAG: hypothetical protein KAR45_04565 [Desulfobacteraceae bacterium]|nr:hypothetical protein [Desulfobacteraceae bacterium]
MKFKLTFFCMLCTAFHITRVIAVLPDIDMSELVSLVEIQENKIQSYQVKYLLQNGKLTDENELEVDLSIECEYGYDMSQGHHYLHHKWLNLINGEEVESKFSFDGKTGMLLNLKMPGSPGNTFGRIASNAPTEIANQTSSMPLWNNCGYFLHYNSSTLSEALKMAKNVKIETDEGNTYKVIFSLTGEKDSFKHPETGKTITFTKDGNFVVWLSERYGFMPLNIAKLNGPLDRGGKISEHTELSDFREIADGLWLPHKIDMKTVAGTLGSSMTIKDVLLNEDAKVISKLQFPPKTYVKDEVLGIEYQVGLSDVFIDSEIDQAVETIDSIKKSDNVDIPDFNRKSDNINGGLSEESGKESSGNESGVDEQINSNQKGNRPGWTVSRTGISVLLISGICILAAGAMLLIRKKGNS